MSYSFLQVKNIGGGFPTRRLIVRLTDLKTNETFTINENDNLVDVKVSLKRNYGGIDPQAQVSICNLSSDNIRRFMTPYFGKEPNLIEVFAGYENSEEYDTKVPLLFSGNIMWAIPTSERPDVWFTITAIENFFNVTQTINWSSNESIEAGSRLEIVKRICQKAGFTNISSTYIDLLKSTSEGESRYKEYVKKQDDFTFQGTLGDFLRNNIFQFGRMTANISSSKISILPNTEDMKFASDKSPYKMISPYSTCPMIGSPKPNITGVNFTTLFNLDILPSDKVTVQSYLYAWTLPIEYWVLKVNYDLHLRGQNFYCHYTAVRRYL